MAPKKPAYTSVRRDIKLSPFSTGTKKVKQFPRQYIKCYEGISQVVFLFCVVAASFRVVIAPISSGILLDDSDD